MRIILPCASARCRRCYIVTDTVIAYMRHARAVYACQFINNRFINMKHDRSRTERPPVFHKIEEKHTRQ